MTVQRAPGIFPSPCISAHRITEPISEPRASPPSCSRRSEYERPQIDAFLALTLGLTRAESRVAAALAVGHSVRDIAVATHRTQATVRSHVRQLHRKLGVHTQADLVRLVLTTAGAPLPRA